MQRTSVSLVHLWFHQDSSPRFQITVYVLIVLSRVGDTKVRRVGERIYKGFASGREFFLVGRLYRATRSYRSIKFIGTIPFSRVINSIARFLFAHLIMRNCTEGAILHLYCLSLLDLGFSQTAMKFKAKKILRMKKSLTGNISKRIDAGDEESAKEIVPKTV